MVERRIFTVEPSFQREATMLKARNLAREMLDGRVDLYAAVHEMAGYSSSEGHSGALTEFVQLADEWEDQYGLSSVEAPRRNASEIVSDILQKARLLLGEQAD